MSRVPVMVPCSQSDVHNLRWDGPFGARLPVYWESCSCGWAKLTAADGPDNAIGVAFDAHVRNAKYEVHMPMREVTP